MRVPALVAVVVSAPFAFAAGADVPPVKARTCTPCHGENGLATQPDAPNLAGQPRAYLAAQLAAYRSGRRSHEQMNVIAKELTDSEVAELAEWFSGFAVESKRRPR